MTEAQQRATQLLRDMASTQIHQPYPDSPVSAEDVEDARHFEALARKNESGTLGPDDATLVLDYFDGEGTIISDSGRCWVELD